uniref:Transcriptional repressor p66-alpha-like protein n=1 Tax=Callorhinchus milii TaxID=7868 RepID=V9KKV7_CALMI
MTDDVYRTRSQKRALEREGSNSDMESKKPKMECSPKGTEVEVDSDLEEVKKEVKIKTEPADRGGGRTSVLLKGSGEVKATIKVEVQAGDEPVDMSTSKSDVKKEKRPPSPDIIVLSDNEPSSPRMNGLTKVPGKDCNADIMMKSTPEERERMIKRLKEELRLEEAKLVLLKKLRQSQIQKEAIVPKQIHNIRTHTSTAPPPLLLAPRASVPNAVQLQGQRIIPHGLIRVANVPNTSLLVNVPQASSTMKGSGGTSQSNAGGGGLTNSNDSPASRQAAAKLALRKQLEKTLLEIPPPKPPAPELTFLPSAANNEFIYLVGLEEVVQNLLETQGKSSAQVVPLEPNVCTQCKTDFTCRWRQEKTGTIMCEQCVTSNKKKALKAEHTNRLKAAFVKALQQEQEIEQRILQQTASPLQSKQESVQHHSMKQSSSQMSRGMQSTSSRAVLHTFSQSSQLQNSVSGLGGRPAKHTERASKGGNTNWRKQIASPAGVTMAYVSPSLSVHKSSSAVDRQREYLLDMIPSRSISQSASTWK